MPAKQQVTVDEVANEDALAQAVLHDSLVASEPDIDQVVADKVQAALEKLIPSLVSAISQTQSNPMIPAPTMQVDVGKPVPEAKINYKKHYRLDGTVDGKFQKINFIEMQKDGESNPWVLDEKGLPMYVIKGEWINVKGDHFFATDDNEVLQVEWMIAHGYRFYEDTGGAEFRCSVVNCNKTFGNWDVLTAHMKATHGVGK